MVGGVPDKLLPPVWSQLDGLGAADGEDVLLLLPAAVNPWAAAQHHCPLGPLQTRQVDRQANKQTLSHTQSVK